MNIIFVLKKFDRCENDDEKLKKPLDKNQIFLEFLKNKDVASFFLEPLKGKNLIGSVSPFNGPDIAYT